MTLQEIFGRVKPIIAVLHLPPLPGSLRFKGDDINNLINFCLEQAKILEEEGTNGIIIENYNDYPYPKRVTNLITLATITSIVRDVVREVSVPIGVNILRNSSFESYCIAYAAGARFIRVNALTEVLITDSGIIEPAVQDLSLIHI